MSTCPWDPPIYRVPPIARKKLAGWSFPLTIRGMDAPASENEIRDGSHHRDDTGSNIKETLESIIVAFILAFIFRCFVVEAFVIPTGSMAPTLLGAHSRYQCPDCGYRFDVNYSNPEASADDTETPDRVPHVKDDAEVVYDDIHCPNCGYRLPPESSPSIAYGDRILVLKYMYLLREPERWDVVVFKSPYEIKKDYSINYIKRLVGRPGETIMILDGDVYVKAKGSDHFEIARKTPAAQEAMWRILYDNDFHPEANLPRSTPWIQPWQQSAGAGKWSTSASNGRVFTFDGAGDSGTLTFHDEADLPANKTFGFSDWLAYDQQHSLHYYPEFPRPAWKGNYPVSDLKLDLYYLRTAGNGPLKLRLTKLEDAFIAEISPSSVRLIHEVNGKPASVEKSAPLAGHGAVHVEFTNVDYQVTLRINGRDVLQTTSAEYHPDIEKLEGRSMERRAFPPPNVSITAEKQACEVSHVSLWRDVYYTPIDAGGSGIHWANFQAVPGGNGGPITLGKDEYFVLGDNSAMSLDGRYWRDPIDLPNEDLHVDSGRVPERFMLGKAFFVYWPAGFKPMKRAPGVAPNFGEMRFVR